MVTQIEHDDILLETLADDLFVAECVDGAVDKPSLRTLGTGASQACSGTDGRLSDDRTASGIRTATTVVAVSTAAAPAAGQALVATADNAATWQAVVQAATFVDNEIPSGLQNGSNKIFTLVDTPISGSEHVFKNGLRFTPTVDYTIVGDTITFTKAPKAADHLLVDYRK